MPITKLQPFNLDANASYTFGTVTATNFVGNGSQLTGIVTGTTVPTIATIGYVGNNTATDVAGGETITLTGTGFSSGCAIIINGAAVGVVSFVSSTQVTFTAPALSAGTYILYLVNTNGATAISVPGISYSGTPSFYTTAGSVGTVYETASFNSNVAATGDSAITYTIASGSLPTGATLNANGIITGSSVLTNNTTTYTFGVNASDGQNQDVTRSYTITVNPDSVAWSSPANGATISLGQGSTSTTTLTAVSAAGKTVTYSANALPTGLSISGNVVTGTPTVLGNTTTLLTATATSTTRTANVTVTWNISVSGEPYFAYNSLLLSGNGTNNANNNTFVDSSTNNFAISRAGNTTQGSFSPYGDNWSNYIPSAGSTFINAGTNTALALGAGNFTIEAWVYLNSLGTYTTIFDWRTNGGWASGIPVFSDYNNNGTLVFAVGTGSGFTLVAASGSAMPINSWFHLALVRNSTTVTMYFNGTSVGSGTDSGTYGVESFNIASPQVANYNAPMYISNVRLVKGTAVYTANFTPPTAPLTAIANTQLLTCQSNRFKDSSSNAFALTVSGSPTVQRFSPFSPGAAYSTSTIGGSAYFDGTGDYLTLSMTGGVGSGDFTIEYWFYPTALYNYITVFATTRSATGLNVGTQAAGQIVLYSAAGAEILRGTTAMKLNTWNHCAFTRSGTTMRGYLNGIQDATGTSSNNFSATSAYIGQLGDGGELPTGYVSDLRIVSGTALYTGATLTIPTAPLTAVTNTRLLTNFTNAGIIDGAMMNNLETVGDAKISTTQSKFGGGSMAFDGTGDYLTQPSSQNFNFGTGNFTMEGWFYQTGLSSSYPAIVSNPLAWGNAGAWGVLSSHAASGVRKLQFYCYNADQSNPLLLGTTSLSDNTWYYFALTRSG
ncbi:MAG: LamG domain-containing protein, partial [Chitinophagia bacterium]